MLNGIKSKFMRKTIKEVASQIAEMPDEPVKEENMDENNNSEEFISKRDLCFLMIGIFCGYMVFHNSFRISSRNIREIGRF